MQARQLQYRSTSSVIAALLDPANSQPPAAGNTLRTPPSSWFSEQELETAGQEVERLATAVGAMPNVQLPADTPTASDLGMDAREQFEGLLCDGWPASTTLAAAMPLKDGEIAWKAINRRRVAVCRTLRDAGKHALAIIADRVLSQHATVCAVDRFWSELNDMYPANRTRLAAKKANKMMLVRNAYRLKHGITSDDKEVERAFWVQNLVDSSE